MSRRSPRIPKYRLHKPTGQAVVRIQKRDIYLGAHNTPQSRERYDRVIAEWLASGRAPDPPICVRPAGPGQMGAPDLSVNELLLAYLKYAQQHYRDPDGRPTGEVENAKDALRPVKRLYGMKPAQEFGPLALRAVRQQMLEARMYQVPPVAAPDSKPRWLNEDRVRPREGLARLVVEKRDKAGAVATPAPPPGQTGWEKVEVIRSRPALSRKVINARVNRIKRVFRWAASMELVPAGVYEGLRTVPGLQLGRTSAPESPGVPPVPVADVEKTLPCCPRPVGAMAKLQLLTGARVGEVLVMRTCDLSRDGPVWEYRPHRHKARHRGRARVIFLGPQAQEVIRPFLLPGEPEAYLFSPARWTAERNAERVASRTSRRQPSQALAMRRMAAPQRKPSARYSPRTYRQAVRRACRRAGVEPWSPLQLRHTRATELRSRYGVETARVILGHTKVETTQIYAERDLRRAAQIMGEVG
jgi:integrase